MTTPTTPDVRAEALEAIRAALAAFPKGWHTAFHEVREREPGVVEIGTPWEDSNSLAEVITVDTGNYYDNAAAMPMAKFVAACNPEAIAALLDALKARDAEIERLRGDLLPLQKFVDAVFGEFPDHGDVDGIALQEMAEGAGLLVAQPTAVPCGDHCPCGELVPEGETTHCYRVQPALRRARTAAARAYDAIDQARATGGEKAK